MRYDIDMMISIRLGEYIDTSTHH